VISSVLYPVSFSAPGQHLRPDKNSHAGDFDGGEGSLGARGVGGEYRGEIKGERMGGKIEKKRMRV
jgi:hypothetical protein